MRFSLYNSFPRYADHVLFIVMLFILWYSYMIFTHWDFLIGIASLNMHALNWFYSFCEIHTWYSSIIILFPAASLSALSPAHQPLPPNPFLRHGSIPGSPFFHPMMHPMMRQHSSHLMPHQPMVQPLGATKLESMVRLRIPTWEYLSFITFTAFEELNAIFLTTEKLAAWSN